MRRYGEFVMTRLLHIVDIPASTVLCTGAHVELVHTPRHVGESTDLISYCATCVKRLLEDVS